MATVAVKLNDVSVTLGKGIKALDAISFELPACKIIGFIGPSGAGKTTLMRAIVGRQRLGQGSIAVLGEPAGAARLRCRVGYMTQEVSVYSDLTVMENLRYFATMVGVPRGELKSRVGETLETVALTPQANQVVQTLSGGQKQRVSLAVTLLGRPELLILDEPTVGLDPRLREQLWELFRRLVRGGTTIILSSHVMEEAERCDELLLLRGGAILASGSPRALCRQTGTHTVEESFLALTQDAS